MAFDRVGIAVDLEAVAIVLAEEGENISATRMVVEIGGDVADAEAAIWRGVIGMRENKRADGYCVAFVPSPLLGEEGGGVFASVGED
jgi:hypothetical protein